MKIELLIADMKIFLKLLLWVIFLEIQKWKLASEILSVTRDLQVFPSRRNSKKKDFSSKKSPCISANNNEP